MPAPEKLWAGGYIGGHAGLARGRIADGLSCFDDGPGDLQTAYFFIEGPLEDFDDEAPCFWNELAGTLDPDNEGFDVKYTVQSEDGPPGTRGYLAGAQIGFNLQLGEGPNGFVIGAEVSHSFANIQTEFQGYAEIFEGPFDFIEWNDRFEISRLTTATVRAGFAFGRVLAYGEVGLAVAQASWDGGGGFNDTEMAHGLVYGGGLEVMAGSNVSLFFEYNRVKLNHDFHGLVDLGIIALPGQVGVQSHTNIFKVGFNIHL
ncbi:MAG: outer membrane protein [Bauldia sp.]